MNKKLIAFSATVALAALPLATLAFDAGAVPNSNASLSIGLIVDAIFALLWPVAVAFFIIMFVVAAFMFFTAQGDPTRVASARQFVIWGIVGVVIALLAFSVPFIIRNVLNNAGAGI